MPTGQKISSLTGQVEYDVAGKQIVSAVNAQVEYDVPGNQLISHVSAQVEYQGDKWQQNVSLTNRHLADYSDLLKDHTFNAHNLTASASAPTVDAADYKEGINSAVYTRASSQYHYITDANLKSGFPLKNGDTIGIGTWCCWVKFNTLETLSYYILDKRDLTTSRGGFTVYTFGTSLKYGIGGVTTLLSNNVCTVQTGRWYHIAFSFNISGGVVSYRVWDDTAQSFLVLGTDNTSATGAPGATNTKAFAIGCSANSIGVNLFDGKINAVHVFNRFLGWKEIDAIRAGTWTKQEDYMGLDVAQVQAQVEYDTFQAQRVYGVSAQVEVDDVVSYTSQLIAQVEYEEPPNLYTSQLIVQVEYEEADVLVGPTAWGHVTGVTQQNTRTILGNWTGTGTIELTGDSERIKLLPGQYMESEIIILSPVNAEINLNTYAPGGTTTIKYRTASTKALCEAASWTVYEDALACTKYIQARIEMA